MIKEKTITLNMNGRSLKWYKSKGYSVEAKSVVEISPFDLPPTSKFKVTAVCEECGAERTVMFADYSPICRKCSAPKNSKFSEMIGPKNNKYNPTYTEEERRLVLEDSRGAKFGKWAYKVKELGNFTCAVCGDSQGGNLESHHLEAFGSCPEKRLDVDNGVCLCRDCHKAFHAKYGLGRNTEKQFKEFVEAA